MAILCLCGVLIASSIKPPDPVCHPVPAATQCRVETPQQHFVFVGNILVPVSTTSIVSSAATLFSRHVCDEIVTECNKRDPDLSRSYWETTCATIGNSTIPLTIMMRADDVVNPSETYKLYKMGRYIQDGKDVCVY